MAAKTMAVRVQFTIGFSRYTDGALEFAVEAKNLRGVIKAVDRETGHDCRPEARA
jgi:hypothetical protein